MGRGGPWCHTAVTPGRPSEPYLMNGYDRKRVELSHDAAEEVTITIEVNFDHTDWRPYQAFRRPVRPAGDARVPRRLRRALGPRHGRQALPARRRPSRTSSCACRLRKLRIFTIPAGPARRIQVRLRVVPKPDSTDAGSVGLATCQKCTTSETAVGASRGQLLTGTDLANLDTTGDTLTAVRGFVHRSRCCPVSWRDSYASCR